MRRSRFAIALALGLATATAFQDAVAQEAATPKRWEGSLGGGVSIPFGDLSDLTEAGWLVTPRLGNYVRPNFCVGIEYAYFDFGGKAEILPLDDPNSGLETSATVHQFTGFGKYLFTTHSVAPYVRVQLGAYQTVLSFENDAIDTSASETKFGLGGGLGVQMRTSGPVGGFVDGIVHAVFSGEETTTFVGIQGGITILFALEP